MFRGNEKVCKTVDIKLQGKPQLGSTRRRLEDNIILDPRSNSKSENFAGLVWIRTGKNGRLNMNPL
jgi:phage terminase large subunit-like protein